MTNGTKIASPLFSNATKGMTKDYVCFFRSESTEIPFDSYTIHTYTF